MTAEIKQTDHRYKESYTKDFVEHWDDLIGWEGREAGEGGFFERLLGAHGVETVADVATGTGFHAVMMAKAGFKVTATDGSANMVTKTRENAERYGISFVDTATVDWRALPDKYGEKAFDCVMMLGNSLTHLFDHESRRDALEALYRVVKPGGIIVLDHRNYDRFLDQGYSTKHQYYYTGGAVEVYPAELNRRLCKMEYNFGNGHVFHLDMYPLRQKYVTFLLEDAGFINVTTFGDFVRPFPDDVDFFQQVAYRPTEEMEETRGGTINEKVAEAAAGKKAEGVAGVVDETKDYYDGPADQIYRDIWGENVHIGTFKSKDDSLQDAMARSNINMAEGAGLKASDLVLDVGCGYGALARFLAEKYGCRVLATNISDKEIAWGQELTEKARLADKVSFEWADFHDLPYTDKSFDVYWSQEAFLHAADKRKVLREAHRVLRDDGRLVFTDILVRHGTPQADRERIYERVKSPDMWDASDYAKALEEVGFTIDRQEDWSENVAPTYAWVRGQLEQRRDEFTRRIGKDVVERTLDALQFWVDSANAGKIGWAYFVARR
ncbi:MAG: methyltransferase domain-containing protein [Azospirillaceae bacterium]